MKNYKKLFGAALAVFALAFAGCDSAGESGLTLPSNDGSGGRQVPVELRLEYLRVYYSADTANNLVTNFNKASADYTILGVESGAELRVEAKSGDPNASVTISWSRDLKNGGSESGSAEPVSDGEEAVLDGIKAPEKGKTNGDTFIAIDIKKGGETFKIGVTIKTEGANTSLSSLSLTEGGSELLPKLDFGGTDDEGEVRFYPSVYRYTAAQKKAKQNITITAKTMAAGSTITLSVDGAKVSEPTVGEIPAEPNASVRTGALFDVDFEVPEGENPPPAADEEPQILGHIYTWTITGGELGADALSLVFDVANEDDSSRYYVTLVPPPDPNIADAHLSSLQFWYMGANQQAIGTFHPDTTEYELTAPSNATGVQISSLTPRGTGIPTVEYWMSNNAENKTKVGDNFTNFDFLTNGFQPKNGITLPAAGSDDVLFVAVKVTLNGKDDETRVYTAKFSRARTGEITTYSGTYTVTGEGYTLSSIKALTKDGGNADVTIDKLDKTWTVVIDKDKGAPTDYIAYFAKGENGKDGNYSVSISAPSGGSGELAFIINSSNMYRLVTTAKDLATIETNQNYLLQNDIDLTELGPNWDGPDGYAATFDGNGKTVTLRLSKTNNDTGMFDTLGNNAVIKNLNVKVTTAEGGLSMGNSVHFGGVVGYIEGNGTYTLSNISISGKLIYKIDNPNDVQWLLAGGLVGEVRGSPTLTISDCEADININANIKIIGNATGYTQPLGFGGLIGKIGTDKGKVTISNSRTTGTIEAIMDNT
ncbi:MAG: hypothetical protein LBH18_07840, partial [Spirochaetaceae bacterium]|nr:hypothetical protein [Spirochaetaceae bacterium]